MASKLATFIVAIAFFPLYLGAADLWLDIYATIIDSRFESHMDNASWRSPGAQWGNARMGVLVEIFAPILVMTFVYLVGLLAAHSKFKQMIITPRGKSQTVAICTAAAFAYIVLYVLTDDSPTVVGGAVAGLFFGGLMVWLIYLTHVAHIPRGNARSQA